MHNISDLDGTKKLWFKENNDVSTQNEILSTIIMSNVSFSSKLPVVAGPKCVHLILVR